MGFPLYSTTTYLLIIEDKKKWDVLEDGQEKKKITKSASLFLSVFVSCQCVCVCQCMLVRDEILVERGENCQNMSK